MTTSAGQAQATAPSIHTCHPQFGGMRDVLVRSLERHLVANDELAEAFRVLTVELEISSLNDQMAPH